MLMRIKKLKKSKKGFTLIELIVVIAILGILAAIAIPRLSGFTEQAKQANDKEAAALVANAAAMYYASTGTTSITQAQLVAAKLIKDADVVMKSDGYSAGITFPIVVTAEVVSVTLTGDGPPPSITISK